MSILETEYRNFIEQIKLKKDYEKEHPEFNFKVGDKVQFKKAKSSKSARRIYHREGVFTIKKIRYNLVFDCLMCFITLKELEDDEINGGLTENFFKHSRSYRIKKILNEI